MKTCNMDERTNKEILDDKCPEILRDSLIRTLCLRGDGYQYSYDINETNKVFIYMQNRISEQAEQLRLIEDFARAALSDLTGLLADQKHDDNGCYKFDGESAHNLSMQIDKTRLIFDGYDKNKPA